MGWSWGGRTVRYSALVGDQTRWHDAGCPRGGAGRTVGDHHPRLWGTSAFCCFCPNVRAA
eukprot:2829461-Prymnesium_polylepis.1